MAELSPDLARFLQRLFPNHALSITEQFGVSQSPLGAVPPPISGGTTVPSTATGQRPRREERDGHEPTRRTNEELRELRQALQDAAARSDSSFVTRALAELDADIQADPDRFIRGALRAVPGVGALSELNRRFQQRQRGRALSSGQAARIQRRAQREDRDANRALREGRGSGASPRRGDVSNAGR